ncbi:uncharacterized protein VTP21DRAFT_149 [Calcarisporiella thermophila]|uniref:uncharacterized protein n=1 Tax=Calcarisporiella thermophila TaxID=911321 RepID=UPI00374405E5
MVKRKGEFVPPPKWAGYFPVLIALVILGAGYYLYVVRLCIQTLIPAKRLAQCIIYLVVAHILFAMFLICYLRVLATPAGSANKPPKELENEMRRWAEKYKAERDIEGSTAPATLASPVLKPASVESKEGSARSTDWLDPKEENASHTSIDIAPPLSIFGKPRFCDKCNWIKPDRAHHCKYCQECVLRMDHHCPWVNGCVGHHNYKFFIQFVFYGGLLTLWGFVTTLAAFIQIRTEKRPPPLDPALIVLLTLSFLFGSLLLGFAIFQIRLVLLNRTTIENLSAKSKSGQQRNAPSDKPHQEVPNPPTNFTQSGENVFDLGMWDNWTSVMGKSWPSWLVPSKGTSGNGFLYPYNHAVYLRLRDAGRMDEYPPTPPAIEFRDS